MPHSFGYRARTRFMFAKDFKKHGQIGLTRYLAPYKVGDFVDIKGDGAIHRGMPHKFYHGKTGVVWNVTPRAVGVEVNKKVGNRFIKKRIHVRIEHVRQSECRKEFLTRLAHNEKLKKEYKAKKLRYNLKRTPALPTAAYTAKTGKQEVQALTAQVYVGIPV